MNLDGFSMHPLVRELDAALAGGRIDKITQPNKQSILLCVRQPGRNFSLLISINPQNPNLHLTQKHWESPSEPPLFCMVLRKQIEAGRIARIRQHSLDRVISIDIDFLAAGGKIVTKNLIAELMGKHSNIILIQDQRIVDSLRKVGNTSSRVRLVLPGLDYALPPGQDKLDPFRTPLPKLLVAIREQRGKKLSQALLDTCLGFGPISVKEAIFSAGLPGDMPVDGLDDADFLSLGNALQELLASCQNAEAKPCLVTGENQKVLAMASFPLHYLPNGAVQCFSSASEMLDLATQLMGSYVLPDKDRFKKLVGNERHRAENKLSVLQKELADAENAEEYKVRGDNLMTYQYQLQDHADASVTLANIYGENGESITIPLDRRLTIIQNMQACYRKYDKLKRAQSSLKEQLRQCRENIQYLSSIEASLMASSSLAEIAEIRSELVAGGYLQEKAKKKVQDAQTKPFRFAALDGMEILVGKNNYQNDRLTFRIARPNDLWLHTKDIPGSHVILRTGGIEPSEESLLLAARLAAHFSKAAGSSNVPVDYTECRYVKKPSGAKPGFVIFTNQKTVFVTPDGHLPPLV